MSLVKSNTPQAFSFPLAGTLYGLSAAVGYSAANVALRAVSDSDPFWVSAVKSLPTVVILGPWLFGQWTTGKQVLPGSRVLLVLIGGGLLGQLGGNVAFQYSLGVVGVAMAVSLCLGAMILLGGLLGWLCLGESVSLRTWLAMGILVASIVVLSAGAGEASQTVRSQTISWRMLAIGVSAALGAGLSYAVLGVVMRYGLKNQTGSEATMFVIGLVGALVLSSLVAVRHGGALFAETTPRQWWIMLAAGLFNTVAFFALTKALELTPVYYVNALNATQAAMAAAAGVFFFSEPLSSELSYGVLLTVVGLLLMRRGSPPSSSKPSLPSKSS